VPQSLSDHFVYRIKLSGSWGEWGGYGVEEVTMLRRSVERLLPS
jgi:hypothetical protein